MRPTASQDAQAPTPKTILIAGATGRTGVRLVEQALARGHRVRAIVRSRHRLPSAVLDHPQLTLIEASILALSDDELAACVKGCDVVVSCLGHVMSFRGVFGAPRRLCTEATERLCAAIEAQAPAARTKFILMNTVGVPNPDLPEARSRMERLLLFLLRWLLPPHRDNETAAAHLHEVVGTSVGHLEWCSVRPDSLVEGAESPYDVLPSPVTGLLTGQPTTRANVARFMTELMDDEALWSAWRFQMPVVMNAATSAG